MSSPRPNYDQMADQLSQVFRRCNWEMSELQEHFPLSEKKTGELSQEDYLRAWMLDQRGSAESLVHALSKWLSLRDIRYLLGLAGKVSLLPNANDKTVLYEWLHHHGFELSKIYDSAWCIRYLKKIIDQLYTRQGKKADLEMYIVKTRKILELFSPKKPKNQGNREQTNPNKSENNKNIELLPRGSLLQGSLSGLSGEGSQLFFS